MNEMYELFPTPLMWVEGLLDEAMVAELANRFRVAARTANDKSAQLAHTEILDADADPALAEVCRQLAPSIAEFGVQLFGESLAWSIKEMWGNVLEKGGNQSMHNHANSFISGVVYLTPSHPSANTVFIKAPAAASFVFQNMHKGATLGPFNASKWIAPDPAPGDVVLFPSYLLHEVPLNAGGQRISLAFNAIPDKLDSWGYAIRFGK